MLYRTYSAAQVGAFRVNAGLSQEVAADLVYVSTRTWRRWESGEVEAPRGLIDLFLILTGQPLTQQDRPKSTAHESDLMVSSSTPKVIMDRYMKDRRYAPV